jgi:hypothetical protein
MGIPLVDRQPPIACITLHGPEGLPMTEAEWLTCERPDFLMRHLKAIGTTRAPRGQRRRKLRLLACAAFGQVKHLLRKEYGVRAIDLAERYADGDASLSDLSRLNEKLWDAKLSAGSPQQAAETTVRILLTDNDLTAAEGALEEAIYGLEWEAAPAKPNLFRRSLRRDQAPLIRDIFGNPFRPTAFDPQWRTDAAVGVAQSIYDKRAFTRLPLLADALEDAGCTDAELFCHLRGPGPHVRGCWAVDLLLAKQ